ncbi:MAG TPA: YCF48-related protein [Pyrinomonadaceae bacterium]|nr:YCF48-related protein [Pyrinomonadaceae bacterium]
MRKFFVRLPLVLAVFALLGLSISLNLAVARANDDATDPTVYSNDWRTTGPPGGDVRGLVVDPGNPDRFYFGTLDGQIYTSADAGHQWQLLYNFGKPRVFIDNIIVDPRNSKVIYVGAHRHDNPGGFFKSTDGGVTWKESAQLKNEALHSLAQSESNPDTLIAGTYNTIFRSDDAGETWKQLPTQKVAGLLHVESLAIDPRTTNTIYAGTFWLPYKSIDGGQTWKSIREGMIDDSDIFAIDIDPRDPNHVIASACSGIYESKNAGENWRKVQGIPSQSRRTRAIMQHPSQPGIVFAGTTEGFWRSDKGGDADSWMVTTSRQLEINSIAVHPSRPDMVYIGTNNYGIMISNDGGKTFTPSNGGFSGRFAYAILPDRETPNRLYASTINTATGGGFFFVSNDNGETWRPSMRSMPSRLITYAIVQDTRDANLLYLGTNLGVYRSLDRGATWAPVWSPTDPGEKKKPTTTKKGAKKPAATTTARSRRPATVTKETILQVQQALLNNGYHLGEPDGRVGTATTAAVKKFQTDRHLPVTGKLDAITMGALGVGASTAGGDVDVTKANVILADAVNAMVHTVDAETQQPGYLAATNTGLYRSLDPNKGWQKLSYGSYDPRTTCISTNLKEPETIWVGTPSSGVLVSRDSGDTWQQVQGIPTDMPVNTVVQDPQRPNNIYVGTKQTVFLSHDGGKTWKRRGGNLPFGDFTSILVNPRNGDEIFIGNAYQISEVGGGVYRSIDGGDTWTRIDPKGKGLPSQRIWALAFDPHDQDVLFVGSHSAGVYVVPRSNAVVSSAH